MGGLSEKPIFFGFIFTLSNRIENIFFTKPKSFGLVLSLQGNTVEKDFQILIKLNFIDIYTIVRGEKMNKNMIDEFEEINVNSICFTKEAKKGKKGKYDWYDTWKSFLS